MKFILWTIVWVIIPEIIEIIKRINKVDIKYSDNVKGASSFMELVLWIVLYIMFIQ